MTLDGVKREQQEDTCYERNDNNDDDDGDENCSATLGRLESVGGVWMPKIGESEYESEYASEYESEAGKQR